jgi:hypothetical protein
MESSGFFSVEKKVRPPAAYYLNTMNEEKLKQDPLNKGQYPASKIPTLLGLHYLKRLRETHLQ